MRITGFKGRRALRKIKIDKAKAAVYIIRGATVGVLITSVLGGNRENAFTCLLTLTLTFIPDFVRRRLLVGLPAALELITVLFVFTANILGEIFSFYEKIPLLDTILHTVNGFVCAGIGLGLVGILNRGRRAGAGLSPAFLVLFSFCFSMTAGVVWEFFEFGMDYFFGSDMQKDTVVNSIRSYALVGNMGSMAVDNVRDTAVNGHSLGVNGYLELGLYDTMKDLFVNLIGALAFDAAGYFYLSGHRQHTRFIKYLIPEKIGDEQKKA